MRHGFLSRGNERSPVKAEMKSGPEVAINDTLEGETLYRLSEIGDKCISLRVHWYRVGHGVRTWTMGLQVLV